MMEIELEKLHRDVMQMTDMMAQSGMRLDATAWEYMQPLLSGAMSYEEHEQWLLELLAKEAAV